MKMINQATILRETTSCPSEMYYGQCACVGPRKVSSIERAFSLCRFLSTLQWNLTNLRLAYPINPLIRNYKVLH